jgi:multiple sugar transport system permease protein
MGWLSQVWPARMAITFAVVTTALGQYVIMFSALMKTIARDLKDAAEIDGAGGWHYQLSIVLPLMTPTILLVVLLSILGTMQMWETVYWMTGGAPGGRTATPIYDIYLTAFNFSHHGLAAAKSIVILAVIAGFVAVKRRVEAWAF